MGESKRRKALDPNYGKKRKSKTALAEEIAVLLSSEGISKNISFFSLESGEKLEADSP